MRVVDRETFLTLPAGTVYAKGQPIHWHGLQIKGESLQDDWYYLNPCWIASSEDEDPVEAMDRAIQDGQSRPMEDAFGRDGMFDSKDLFLIFEPADLQELIALFNQAVATSQENHETQQ